jgi:UDP-N-acetylmuramoyl-tripeptide--D-alanyl-D-alanine ligase
MVAIETLYQIYKQYPVVCSDTRKITPGCLFFALKGPNYDANLFAKDAIKQGAAYAIVDNKEVATTDQYILVEDVLTTLQQLASYHRKQLKTTVLAIVGSNGKTTTKELIAAVLSTSKNILATPGNLNNHIGLPLTLLMLTEQHEIAVIEMGANHIGENALLCDIAAPDCGLITNNGMDHLEGFGSIEGVAKSNSELYYYLLKHGGIAFVNEQDETLMRMAGRLSNKVTYAGISSSETSQADICGIAISLRPTINFSIIGFENNAIKSHLSGQYNFDNIMAAVCVGLYFKLTIEDIAAGISTYVPSNNRSQIIKLDGKTIFLDAYNANPSSMKAALENFAHMQAKNKLAILGDMYELGSYTESEHESMVAFALSLPLQQIWLVGKHFNAINYADERIKRFLDKEQLREFIEQSKPNFDFIFMKGSRGVGLEKLVDTLKSY